MRRHSELKWKKDEIKKSKIEMSKGDTSVLIQQGQRRCEELMRPMLGKLHV
jgi:hypothetical protein